MNGICDICKSEPAIYGDGLTWARCARCHYEQIKNSPPTEQTAVGGEGIPHQIKEGLVSIILPIYNTNYSLFHYTGNCIGSIREHTDKEVDPYELIVVDNGSPIQPPSLNSYYADKIIKNESNLGVTKAWNQGIRASFGEYIVLLNNDTQVFLGWLRTMKTALENCDLVMAHPMYSLTEPFARAVEAGKVLSGVKHFDPLEKDFSCVMFKKSLLNEIGLFDEQFISWCSDGDLFKRMEEKGKTYKMLDQVAIHHISDATGYSMGEEAAKIMDEDKKRFQEKWEKREEKKVEEVEGLKKDKKLIRVINGGDALYLLIGSIYYHMKNPETLKALGYDFGQEQSIPSEEFKAYQKGEDIDMNNYQKYA